METASKIGYLIILSIVSGVLGRLGGRAKDGSWYDCLSHSWARDWVCPLIALISLWLMIGVVLSYWWTYLLIYGLTVSFLTTYWDWLFKEDNLLFSGFAVGLALVPAEKLNISIWLILIRAILLAVIWGCLNKYLPSAGIDGKKRILLWRRDIFEEFWRYFFLTYTLLLV